jgi:hypothetical protein
MPLSNPIADVSQNVLQAPEKVILADLSGNGFTLQNGAIPVQQQATAAVNGTLQNAANANGAGTVLSLLGSASIIFTVNQSGFTGTVNFECTEDNTNWDPLQTQQVGTNTITTTVTGSTTTSIHLYEASVAGFQSVRARVSGYSAGTVTVTAHAIPTTDASRVVNNNPYGKNVTAGDTPLAADSGGALRVSLQAQQTPVTGSAAVAVNTSNSASLSAVASKTNYITGFSVTTQGGSAAAGGAVTITGIITGTLTFEVGAAAGNPVQVYVQFPSPIPASAANTAITLTVPALGANTGAAACTIYGYQQ